MRKQFTEDSNKRVFLKRFSTVLAIRGIQINEKTFFTYQFDNISVCETTRNQDSHTLLMGVM